MRSILSGLALLVGLTAFPSGLIAQRSDGLRFGIVADRPHPAPAGGIGVTSVSAKKGNHAWTGAIVGGVAGTIFGIVVAKTATDYGGSQAPSRGGQALVVFFFAAIVGGLGALIGSAFPKSR